jgi:hypothetical protein
MLLLAQADKVTVEKDASGENRYHNALDNSWPSNPLSNQRLADLPFPNVFDLQFFFRYTFFQQKSDWSRSGRRGSSGPAQSVAADE